MFMFHRNATVQHDTAFLGIGAERVEMEDRIGSELLFFQDPFQNFNGRFDRPDCTCSSLHIQPNLQGEEDDLPTLFRILLSQH